MLETILSKCDKRNDQHGCEQCADCSYDTYCPHDCEKCLDYIHNPSHAPDGAPERKYDCTHMANVYMLFLIKLHIHSQIIQLINRSIKMKFH